MSAPSLLLTVLFACGVLYGTEPPQIGRAWPEAYYERLHRNPKAFTFDKAFIGLANKAREGRQQVAAGAQPLGILTEVRGHKRIVIILVQFSDTNATPFPPATLASELFGTWPSGTLSDYYQQSSYGNLQLSGDVMAWKRLSHDEAYYAGNNFNDDNGQPKPCHGICDNSRIAELVEEAIKLNDTGTDWGRYDNDGVDDKPNSGDDDGQVDFVAIIHPGKGAECEGSADTALWSHHDKLTGWPGHSAVATKTQRHGAHGSNIQVNDYVLVPAVACDGRTMIQIGVIAHEFGHSFGLPDLYDTSEHPRSEGLGNWDLMAGGSWGGDGQTPERPSQMSAWTKAFLGWVKPKDVDQDMTTTTLSTYESTGETYLVTIRGTQPTDNVNRYYLVSNRQKIGFDANLPGSGIFVERVDEGVLSGGLANNTVNSNPDNMGVELIEADGLRNLVHHSSRDNFRGGPGDLFPGSANRRTLDRTTYPALTGTFALCNIGDSAQTMTLGLLTSRPTCSAASGEPSATSVSVESLQYSMSRFANTPVRVSGTLVNEAKNYFTEPIRLALRDDMGHQIPVEPWLRMEVPPVARGPGSAVLSEYLERRVELVGHIEKIPSNGYALRVNSARILH